MSQHGAAGPPLLLNWNISQVFHVGLEHRYVFYKSSWFRHLRNAVITIQSCMLTITRSWNINQDLLIKNINRQNLTQSSLDITVLITLYLLQNLKMINLIKWFCFDTIVYILIRNAHLLNMIKCQLCLQCACFLTNSFT